MLLGPGISLSERQMEVGEHGKLKKDAKEDLFLKKLLSALPSLIFIQL